ncbi:hypothetical protein DFH07DRAFT_192575 [Mycena maculata]|uniref:S1 motif domain-containing protein n=1 Tax=Mycena maculata TaxID=230809 RepID=A0AAD7P0N7_9AGAR|nr:hypothetical protein DFH07DRAFT_192575 [Mycena maculata]
MAALKRPLDDPTIARKSKKTKMTDTPNARAQDSPQTASKLVSDEVDFPRGGGTSFTPLEVKAIRAEAVKEANAELFEDAQAEAKQSKKRKRKSEVQPTSSAAGEKSDRIRIEHLNYKRLTIGMKILGQIVAIEPLAVIVSLPNQLFAHVPITNISSQLTSLLESSMDEDKVEEDEEVDDDSGPSPSRIPDLSDIFHPGQYIRTVVTTVHAAGSSDMSGIGKSRDEVVRASRRVELSLVPERVNAGVHKSDLRAGFTLSAAIQSVEDHGYILNLGVAEISGFISFKDAKQGPFDAKTKLPVGRLLDVTITSVSSNGRTCNVSIDSATFFGSCLTEVTNANSVLPGTLVQTLITAVHPTGLNLQVLGFFDGTVDQFHLRADATEKTYKIGKKVKARVLYDFSSTPPRFALALTEHVLGLGVQKIKTDKKHTRPQTIQEAYPIGTTLEAVKVVRLEAERGVVVDIDSGALQGFVHISHVSEEHVPSLSSSGPWKPGSIHRARVTGYFPFDGLLQLSMKTSVLDQKFMQVADVHVGEMITGSIKKLNDSGLFVSMSGNVDGVVWPNHYADITLKHPGKRFKAGANIKCRVLVVDPERKRISLTAKKTLVESTLPIIATLDDAKIGTVTHAVVFKVFEKHLMVEFFNNLKALVPAREISETAVSKLSESFPIGKVVKVRVINLEPEQGRIVASIRQASSNFDVTSDISVGNIVEGTVSEIHADNAVLTLHPSQVRALISLNNLANQRKLTVAQLRVLLKVGERLDDLVVVTRNVEKSFVIVACKPKTKAAAPAKGTLTMESVAIGNIVGGRVTRHTRHGALVKLASRIGGTLHPTDTSDDYDAATPFPVVDSVLKASVIGIDQAKKQLTLSTRHSRMYPDQVKPVVDREIKDLADLQVGQTIRGFIKSVAEHGLFVTIGRDIDARVQIKELFDDYVKEWKVRFNTNQLVKGRILSVDLEAKKVEMTFRSGDFSKASTSSLSIADLKEGQKVDGIVNRIEDYGLFIQIEGSKINGLCHKSQLSDNPSADVAVALRGFREGDRVKAYVMNIDKRKVSLSLKPSHFDEEDFNEAKAAEPDSDDDAPEASDVEEDIPGDVADEDDENDSDEEVDAMHVDIDPQSHLYQSSSKPQKPSVPTHAPSLQLSGGFQWSANPMFEAEEDGSNPSDSDDDPDDDHTERKKKKRRKKEIEQDLTADMHIKTPESNADFERLLLGSPNSSYLWVQYMSFQLQLSEVEKARTIARRALQTINFREEQEKLNIWIALLNLENAYGTDETIESTFKEAARSNDSKTIHLRLALIFDQSDKSAKAEEQYQRTCKKFGQSSKVWTLFSEYYLRKGNVEDSRKLLPRSLQSLDKRKHLKTISRFAQLEYKLGDPERGKTLFEGIVDSHPKRLDLWSVYMDMEAGQEQIQTLRNLFDRVLKQKMTSHKAKAFFKKWLELEKRIGDEEGVANVKAKAVEWTQRANAS